jgi:TolB-like protein
VITDDDRVALDLGDCRGDALDLDRLEIDRAEPGKLAEACHLIAGELLEGDHVDDNPAMAGWLAAQRARYRTIHVALLEALASRALGPEERFRWLDRWLQLAPYDRRPHDLLLGELARCGRLRDGEHHLAATIRAFEQEGIDWAPLRDAWHAAREPRIEIATSAVEPAVRRRAAVAVMPFVDKAPGPGNVADGLTEDIIVQLAKLRVLFVIARGTVFALADRGVSPEEAARILNVDYVVTGNVRRVDGELRITVELIDDGTIVWTDSLRAGTGDTLAVLDAVTQRIVAAIAEEIEAAECRLAVLKTTGSLDAWESYHRGLWHMYKFTGPENRHAERFFTAALELDPTFARAYAGLSFTHFQNAFLDLTQDRAHQIELAFETAGQSLDADDHDPAAHWAMGRALWLRGIQDESLAELQRSVELSPNFALGHYTLGFVHSQLGDPRAAIEATNYSRQLSPFDPLQFAMLASRALAHVRLDELNEAAEWAVKATARPNAHAHILAIAAECLALADRHTEARGFVARIRERLPAYTIDDFLRAFRFPADTEKQLRRGARQIGFAR